MKSLVVLELENGHPTRPSLSTIEAASQLSAEVDLLILDEATSALDKENSKSILNSVKNLKNKNISVVLVTHNNIHLEICEKIYHLINGELKEFKKN